MYDNRQVIISILFLKLKVHKIGMAKPTITKRIKALKYIKGMKNCSFSPITSVEVARMI